MKILNFYPGPSRVYPNITEYIYEAYMEGIMSINHRSDAFMELMADTKAELRTKLLIPADYQIIFLSSATESWEVISQSLVQKKSQHFYNGSFGEKWMITAAQFHEVTDSPFIIEGKLPTELVDSEAEVICITQNETSNGTQVDMDTIAKIRSNHSDKLIALDVTSSLGGVKLDFSLGDIWYASVQKCLGLPAGMGLMVLSPASQNRIKEVNERQHYNSLANILDHAEKNQTQYTPNVLGIYLLNRTQKKSKGIEVIEKKLSKRAKFYYEVFSDCDGFKPLVNDSALRSKTVIALTHPKPHKVIKEAESKNIVLGKGYGPWKESTMRIANFPAIRTKEIEKLFKFFNQKYFKS